jgi:hypothetical protein
VSRPLRLPAGLLLAAAALAGCTAGTDPDTVARARPPAPPAAACLLDTGALAATTGLSWLPDAGIATDTRCVYDPQAGAGAGAPASGDGPAFVTVEVAPARGGAADTELDTVAELCEPGSRAPVPAGDGGFVCRFQDGSVYAALVRDRQIVTVAASAVPPGTTAARLVVAFGEQLAAIAG